MVAVSCCARFDKLAQISQQQGEEDCYAGASTNLAGNSTGRKIAVLAELHQVFLRGIGAVGR